ncbi:M67 family metallopeptidase [Sphingomonas sp. HF-S4]|uniref:M67 family metallopeptidase n=1 Tax=Sphingomonas agrestis TaxID=3080540 RepID=A0ABU3Y6K0_9SPHN|nr:M67 family metallopeptidase [Sphingomonas sp. HF-S4]MDV3457024.1 M67 family metallopeptidase [Sphingomonas sp. HF-S4]
MAIRVSRSVPIGIRRISADCAPREACGLLFGDGDTITGFQATENVAEDPGRHFEIDPAALFAALRAERAGGPKIIGYWHSHPSGAATPSVTDAAMAAPDGKLWLIVAGEVMTLWRASEAGTLHGRFDPVNLGESLDP